jgi:uncharacterized protein YidB (DUF937 family)
MLDDVLGSERKFGDAALNCSWGLCWRPVHCTKAPPPARRGCRQRYHPVAQGGLLGRLGGLLQRFQQNGLADAIHSWMGPGQNQATTPNQLGSALGSDIVKTLAARSGLSEQELTSQLSKIPPTVVDRLTSRPLPTETEISRSG